MRPHVADHLVVHALCGAAQGKLTQRRQISRNKIVLRRAFRGLREVDFAFLQSLQQILGCQIDKFNIVGTIENRIGDGLADAHAGDFRHHVVEAFEMLHIQRRVHVDAGGEKFFDIHVSFGMAAALDIGVRKFVHQHELRLSLKHGIEVQIGEHASLIGDALFWNRFEAFRRQVGFNPSMRLHYADDDVDAFELPLPRLCEHLVGLSYAVRGAEKYLEPAAVLLLRLLQQRIG